MKNWEFKSVHIDDWKNKIIQEIGKGANSFFYFDEIENLSIDITKREYKSRFTNQTIDCINRRTKNSCYIEVENELEANKLALYCLNFGAEALFFKIKKIFVNWEILLKHIEIKYIKTWFQLEDEEQKRGLLSTINPLKNLDITIQVVGDSETIFNGFHLQQIGSPAYLEIAYILHSLNCRIINMNKDELENSDFIIVCGLNGNYFLDIAKINSLKYLVKKIFETYNLNPRKIEYHAHTGWSNKSIEDPDINLLRQTTEVMAAFSSNVDAIFCNPGNYLSVNKSTLGDWRLSLNIFNLLKEESYFDKVLNPLDGAYIYTQLVDSLIVKSWGFFVDNQNKSNIEFLYLLKEHIQETRNLRLKLFNAKENVKIGINIFKNKSEEIEDKWRELPSFLGMPYFVYEKEMTNEKNPI